MVKNNVTLSITTLIAGSPIYGTKMNSLPGSNFQYFVTFRIDIIRMITNTFRHTEYHRSPAWVYCSYFCAECRSAECNDAECHGTYN